MTSLKNWTAKRSGAAITVDGITSGGIAQKVSDIRLIRPSQDARFPGTLEAITKGGQTYILNV